jgi:hypothetical protein
MQLFIAKFKISQRLYIYERLRRYRHFLLIQDTSGCNEQNLIPLIDNALSGQDDYGEKEL